LSDKVRPAVSVFRLIGSLNVTSMVETGVFRGFGETGEIAVIVNGLTVPLTLMSCSVAPVLSALIMPLTGPSGAVAAMRARMVVVPTVPPDSVKSRAAM